MALDEPSSVSAIIGQDDNDDDSGYSTLGGRKEIDKGCDSRLIVDAEADTGALTRVLELLDR